MITWFSIVLSIDTNTHDNSQEFFVTKTIQYIDWDSDYKRYRFENRKQAIDCIEALNKRITF